MKVLVSNDLALVVKDDSHIGLQRVVYTNCPINGCEHREGETEDCTRLLKEYEENQMRLSIPGCHVLKTECLLCS